MPPNTTFHYDYENATLVASDIADWTPAGGATQFVNVDTWGDRSFAWPDGNATFPQRKETQWYIHWRQSIPGYANAIQLGAEYMTNWWAFKGDWDASIGGGLGLHSPAPVSVLPGSTPAGVGLRMGNAWPNPMRSSAALRIDLERPGWLRVDIIDVTGHRVRTLADQSCPAGHQTLLWDGRLAAREAPPGFYWFVATFEGERAASRVVLMR